MIDITKSKEFSIKKVFGNEKYTKWIDSYPIFENKDVQSWIIDMIDQYTDEGKNAERFVVSSYLKPLQQYCIFNQVDNPSDLLNEVIDIRNSRVKKYLKFLLDVKQDDPKLKELEFRSNKIPSDVTIRNMIQSRIKSFYSNRGKSVSFGMKTRKSGANKSELDLNQNIIKKIEAKLESINYRLICKFESQTGLRISDILEEMTNGKYNIEFHEKKHYFIRQFETQKEKVIINWLFFTQELAELLQSTTKINDLTQLDLTTLFMTRNNTRINRNDYLDRLKKIIKELGIDGNIKTHSFRKFFCDEIDDGEDIDNKFNHHIEGREPNYRDEVYKKKLKNIKWYYKKWLNIEKKICITCIFYDNTAKGINELQDKYKNAIREIIEKDKEITELKTSQEAIIFALGKELGKEFIEKINIYVKKHPPKKYKSKYLSMNDLDKLNI